MEVKGPFLFSSAALIFLFSLCATAARTETKPCVAPRYKVSTIPLRPASINQSGEIAGTTSAHKAALWCQQHGSQEIDLLPGYTSSEGVALNSGGQLIGIAVDLRTNRRQGFTYKDSKLLALSNGARPLAINDAGVIAGEARTSSNAMSGPVLWGNLIPISLGGCCGGTAVAINQNGQVIGKIYDQQGHYHAFLREKGGELQQVGPASDYSSAVLLNDAGMIAGEARTSSNGMSGPVLWDNLVPISLGGCCGGTAVAINQKGQVIGKTYDQQGHYHAFLRDKGGELQSIGPASDFSSALLLNDAGDYLLQLFPGGLVFHHDGKPSHLTLAPQAPSHPRAMNSCPAIVGSFGIFPDYYRAFAWDMNRGFQDLNSLIPADSGLKLEEATSINEHGDIVGWGELHGEESVGFLLTPLQ